MGKRPRRGAFDVRSRTTSGFRTWESCVPCSVPFKNRSRCPVSPRKRDSPRKTSVSDLAVEEAGLVQQPYKLGNQFLGGCATFS